MNQTRNVTRTMATDSLRWRKSSLSQDGQCAEIAELSDGRVAIRNSNDPDLGTIYFTRAELAAWIGGCKLGEFDDLI